MNCTPNHTAADALAYVVNIVKARIDAATDSIGGNIPTEGSTPETIYNGNEWALDFLNDLTKEVVAAARPHLTGSLYSDGRPIWSTVDIENTGSRMTHYWNPDPDKDSGLSLESLRPDGRTVITFTPPSTAEATFYPNLVAIGTAETDTESEN